MGDEGQPPSWRARESGRNLILLTVGLIVAAGVLSGGAALWHTERLSDSHHEAAERELEQRGLAYVVAAAAFLDALGPQAPEVLSTLLGQAITRSEQGDVAVPGTNEFYTFFLGFQLWAPDPAAPTEYRFLSGDAPEGAAAPAVRSEAIGGLVSRTARDGAAAAVLDEEHREIHVSLPIDLGQEAPVIFVGTLSAEEELALLESTRSDALRETIIASIAIFSFLSVVGIILSRLVARHLVSRERMEEVLREQTRRDPLTGALNHAAIVDELRTVIASQGDASRCAVAMVDIDGMKATNDTFGHQMGDVALVTVARAMAADGAIIGRYGGDEFVAILPGADRTAAERYREEVSGKLTETTLKDPTTAARVPISVSIGLAVYPDEAGTVVDLIKLSDTAMYSMRRQRPVPLDGKRMPPRRNDETARAIGELVPLLTAPGRLDDNLNRVAHRLCVSTGYDVVSIQLYAPEPGGPVESHTVGSIDQQFIATWDSYLARDDVAVPIRQQLESTKRPLIVETPQDYPQLTPELREILAAAGIRSGIVAPMVWQDHIVGSIAAGSKKAKPFGPRDAQFLAAIAAQVIAIVRLSASPEPRRRKKRAA